MRTDQFDFDLPRQLIAQHPAQPRDTARLLVVNDRLGDHGVADLPRLLRVGDVLVVNDTRVIPARLRGLRGETPIEVTLHKPVEGGAWRAFARPARRLRIGDRIRLGDGFEAEVRAKNPEGDVMLSFHGMALEDGLARFGTMPLPPYITRTGDDGAADGADYQTVYATVPGAVAAPTAGLHFTDELLSRLEASRIGLVRLTLHVGAGTFLPVRAIHIEHHTMHAERGVLSADAAASINRARAAGGRVVAVGSTSLRLLESAAGPDGQVRPFAGETDIFITPGYRFRVADLLLTNFHLPRSTLFMLVAAFAGLDRMRSAYEHAKRRGYRFYSYGDATLLQRGDAE